MIKATGDDQDALLTKHTKATDRINDDLIELQDDAYSLGREHSQKEIEELKLELEQIKEAICIVCIEEMFTDEPFVTDADCIDTFVGYAKGLKEI